MGTERIHDCVLICQSGETRTCGILDPKGGQNFFLIFFGGFYLLLLQNKCFLKLLALDRLARESRAKSFLNIGDVHLTGIDKRGNLPYHCLQRCQCCNKPWQ